ncbi:MAG: dephospho-CoA kinase [Synechococcus sp.]|uniref:dephospho-CoA kinase n=1 Tax=Synechococcus sp. BMK-MC-1 TaxID=1442551 RepID=UPI0016483C85|nr:dephospho-CoA kinase [Synechococcus sp. BMK-MC-1]QNI68991.1 dephospho-CoA kinase [Synechococcus sp. BMK-MC-1]
MPSQRRIGLTGGIASGKSSVGRWLSDHGLPVLDADRYARDALAPGSAGCQAVLKRYGPAVAARGARADVVELNRSALADIVFADAVERQWLEQLIHPLVRQAFDTALGELELTPAVVLMVPLLYESGLESLCTEVWVVRCSKEQQQQRLIQRNRLSAQQADQRIEAQWPLARKCLLADQIIDNSGEPGAWTATVASLLEQGSC